MVAYIFEKTSSASLCLPLLSRNFGDSGHQMRLMATRRAGTPHRAVKTLQELYSNSSGLVVLYPMSRGMIIQAIARIRQNNCQFQRNCFGALVILSHLPQ